MVCILELFFVFAQPNLQRCRVFLLGFAIYLYGYVFLEVEMVCILELFFLFALNPTYGGVKFYCWVSLYISMGMFFWK